MKFTLAMVSLYEVAFAQNLFESIAGPIIQ